MGTGNNRVRDRSDVGATLVIGPVGASTASAG